MKATGTLSELDLNQNESSRIHLFCIAALLLHTLHSSESFYIQCNNHIKRTATQGFIRIKYHSYTNMFPLDVLSYLQTFFTKCEEYHIKLEALY